MAARTRTLRETKNHREIRAWIEQRGGIPAVSSTGRGDADSTGTLRVHFPDRGPPGDTQQVPWDEFFRKFDEAELTFVYDAEGESGSKGATLGTLRFHKFIRR